jgi:HK97 family phage major capsid protein
VFGAAGGHGRAAIDVPELTVRSLIDNQATSGGAFQNPSRPATIPQTYADRIPRVADLLDRQTTGDNTVEYVRDTTAAGAGGAAAETSEGSAKPETTYTFEVVTDSVRTVAHWLNITRQTLADNQQLEGYFRGRLTYGLLYRLDGQILNGNGSAPNLRGILNTSGINTYAPSSPEARVISIRKAITQVQQDEYAASGVVLNPADWELVELSTDDNGSFRVSPNVQNAMGPRIWGLAVVPSTAIASGTGLVGDFRMGATLWDRQQAQVFITDSHASNFTSNILTMLAELRVALSVWRPSCFCKITFNGTE